MKKKTKFAALLIILIILIIICKSILTFDSINYKLNINGNKLKIKEIVNNDNYYIEIKTNKNIYPFRIYEDLSNKRKVVKDIYLYKDDNIECVLPVINDELYTDMVCYKDEILYNYYNLVGNNTSLDKYVNSIELYNINEFGNKAINTETIGTIKYNIFTNLSNTVAITTYKGLTINDNEINLFKKDIYNNKLSTFIDNYYIIADYEKNYSFNYFYVVNLDNRKINKLESKNDISYDSYIQGIVDNKIYLYDKDNEIQYEIDVKGSSIDIISSDNYIKYYSNNKWEKMNKTKANKEIYFNYETLDNIFTSYDFVEETDNYYYLLKKDGISYKLYRVDKDNIDVYKYLLDVPTTNIYFNNDYLYYVYKNKLFYYSDGTGLKTILENSELEFNDTIKYYIY
ncbi:MAG: hypothetical protein E7174_03450 [Firmicutes bacterium]|nr:hypothetical protein [Bacillota bacterium]